MNCDQRTEMKELALVLSLTDNSIADEAYEGHTSLYYNYRTTNIVVLSA